MPQQVPGKSLPKGKRETDEQAVMKLLYQHSPSISEKYEKWGQEHPILQMGGEMAAQYALDQLGPGILKKLPGAFRTAGHVWEMVRDAGGPIWDERGAARHIADPLMRVGDLNEVVRNRYEIRVEDVRTGEEATHWSVDYNPEKKQIYIGYAETPGAVAAGRYEQGQTMPAVPAYGTGQYRHILREIARKAKAIHPELETVKFYRATGAGPRWKGYTEDVTMPYELLLPKAERTEKTVFAEGQRKSRIVRERRTLARQESAFARRVREDREAASRGLAVGSGASRAPGSRGTPQTYQEQQRQFIDHDAEIADLMRGNPDITAEEAADSYAATLPPEQQTEEAALAIDRARQRLEQRDPRDDDGGIWAEQQVEDQAFYDRYGVHRWSDRGRELDQENLRLTIDSIREMQSRYGGTVEEAADRWWTAHEESSRSPDIARQIRRAVQYIPRSETPQRGAGNPSATETATRMRRLRDEEEAVRGAEEASEQEANVQPITPEFLAGEPEIDTARYPEIQRTRQAVADLEQRYDLARQRNRPEQVRSIGEALRDAQRQHESAQREASITDSMRGIIEDRASRLGITHEQAAEHYLAEDDLNRRSFGTNVARALGQLQEAPAEPRPETMTELRYGDTEGFHRWLRGSEDPVGQGVEENISRQPVHRASPDFSSVPQDNPMYPRGLPSPGRERQVPEPPRMVTAPDEVIGGVPQRSELSREDVRRFQRAGFSREQAERMIEDRMRPPEPPPVGASAARRADFWREHTDEAEHINRILAPYESQQPEGSERHPASEQELLRRLENSGLSAEDQADMRRRYIEQHSQSSRDQDRLRRVTPELQARIDAFTKEVTEHPEFFPHGTEMLEDIRRGDVDPPNSQDDIDAWLARRR